MLPLCQLAKRLMRCPAVPGQEDAVRAEVEAICAEHHLNYQRDPFGNLLVRLQTAPSLRPIALAAHLDHPGFKIVRPLAGGVWRARFLGGVPDRYFRPGLALRLMPGSIPARLGKKVGPHFEIHCTRPPATPASSALPTSCGSFAVWALPDFRLRRQIIYGRACDDLIGVAAVLATCIELKQRRARVNVLGLLSRAEEIGFVGALTLAAAALIPKDALIISLETSRELPPVKMGQGMILRVGDRASIFDSAATRFLAEVANRLKTGHRPFPYQRALMSGGTCEATAYQEFGFQSAAVCIALGNYHNCGPDNKIAPEYVHVADACGMVRLLVETARRIRQYPVLVGKLPKRLQARLTQARHLLKPK